MTENLVNNISKDHGDKYNFVTTTETKNQPVASKTVSSDKDTNNETKATEATEAKNSANVLQNQSESATMEAKNENTSVESEENSNEQGRANLLYDDGKRNNNGGSQKPTERILSFRRRNQGKNATERADFARGLIQRGLVEERSTDNAKYNLVKPEAYNDDMLAMAEDAKRRGVELRFFVGRMEVEVELDDGTKVTKLMSGLALPSSRVAYVQYDDTVESPQQIYKHELCHTKWYSPEMQKIKNTILNSLTEAEKQKIKQTQRFKDYMTAYKKHKNREAICWEEFVCDVMAGKTQYTANFIDTAYDYWYGNESFDSYSPAEYTTSTDAGGKNKSNKRWNIAEEGNVEDEKTRDNRTRTERLPERVGNQRNGDSGNSENLSNGNSKREIQSSGGKVDGKGQTTTKGSRVGSVGGATPPSSSAFSSGRTGTDGERFLVALREGDNETARTLLNEQAVKSGFVPAHMYHGTLSDDVFTQFESEVGIHWVTPSLLSMDVDEIEKLISPKTKAIMAVHYIGYPCDMDKIMEIAKKHNLKVIEDVSHAQGGLYKGRRLGTIGDVGAMSLMSTKSFAAGELGMLVTNDKNIYERAMAYAHYDRNNSKYITDDKELFDYYHIALGGVKGRANQLCSAIARVQLKYYDERCAEIRRAMNYLYDLIGKLPGIKPVRVDESSGSNMAGFYAPNAVYDPSELGGLPVGAFVEAYNKEIGAIELWIHDGANKCLHTHNFFKTFDFNGSGKPSRIADADRDVRELDKECEIAERKYCFSVPWIKKYDKKYIEKIADAFKAVVENHLSLLDGTEKRDNQRGRWYGFENTQD